MVHWFSLEQGLNSDKSIELVQVHEEGYSVITFKN